MPRLTPLPLFVAAGICCSVLAFRTTLGPVASAQAANSTSQGSTGSAAPEAVVTEPQPVVPQAFPELAAIVPAGHEAGLQPAPAPSDTARVPAVLVLAEEAGQDNPQQASAMLARTNSARNDAGLGALERDATLDAVARVRAADLVAKGYFDHFAPDGSSAFSELALRGIGYGLAGENLARNTYRTEESVAVAFDALMKSPGHRANILEPRFTRVGIAAVHSGRMWFYVTVFTDGE